MKNNTKDIQKALKTCNLEFNGIHDYVDVNQPERHYGDLNIALVNRLMNDVNKMQKISQSAVNDPVNTTKEHQTWQKRLQKDTRYKHLLTQFSQKHPSSYTFVDMKQLQHQQVPTADNIFRQVSNVDNQELKASQNINQKAKQISKESESKHTNNQQLGTNISNLARLTTKFQHKYSDHHNFDLQAELNQDYITPAKTLQRHLHDVVKTNYIDTNDLIAKDKDYQYVSQTNPNLYVQDLGLNKGIPSSEIKPLQSQTVKKLTQKIQKATDHKIKYLQDRQKQISSKPMYIRYLNNVMSHYKSTQKKSRAFSHQINDHRNNKNLSIQQKTSHKKQLTKQQEINLKQNNRNRTF